ncbi:Peptidase M56, BlaR1 (modular protein) [Candidatus Sulfopaludibacter sp. SbA3]|nr:Peptidase M56, BlaR1 (modular protein) [Candidatus Sulfopaludibacter sp. SbA3]
MTTIQFLAEWALRSSILILSGALLLRALRVKNPAIRLAAWTAMLCGSLAIPVLTPALPKMPVAVKVWPARPAETQPAVYSSAAAPEYSVSRQDPGGKRPFDWARAVVAIYVLVAGGLLLRLGIGLAMSVRLRRSSRATGRMAEGIEIRESLRVAAPVTLGITRCAIVLPGDWREWDEAKLDAVLAHERSHIRRHDPAVQLLSALHRALIWHSPLTWLLHRNIVRVAEEASDDAAVAATRDRASYAEVLLDFMQRGVRGARWQGVAMARYGRPDERIHRILDGTSLSGGITRWSIAAILVLGSPLMYVAAAARPQVLAVANSEPAEAAASAEAAAPQAATAQSAPARATAPRQSGTIRRYLIFDGTSTSGSWDSNDPVDQNGLRERFGRHFAWFRQGRNEYVVTDAGVLDELHRAMEPQKEVNRMQDEVNQSQSVANDLQSRVNAMQGEVNALQEGVNRRQDIVNRIQSAANNKDKDAMLRQLQAAIQELQSAKTDGDQASVNRRQAAVNAEQGKVNAEQDKVNGQQAKVNEQQRRVSAEYSGRIEEILNSAVQRRLVQRLM